MIKHSKMDYKKGHPAESRLHTHEEHTSGMWMAYEERKARPFVWRCALPHLLLARAIAPAVCEATHCVHLNFSA